MDARTIGLINGTIGTTNGTNVSTNGNIGTDGTIGCRETFRVLWLPMVPLATNGTIVKISNGIIGRIPNARVVWSDRLSKSGSPLSPSKAEKFIEIMNDHHLEQLAQFPTREENTLDLIITSLPDQFLDI